MSSQPVQEFEDNNDWTEKFIQQVQSKPAIYTAALPEHSDRNLISRLWNEICEAMVPGWQDMTPIEKSVKGKELQNRWRNLRTCFRRELKKQSMPQSGQAAHKRRKYVYYDQLLFLLPTMEDQTTPSDGSPPNTQEDFLSTEDDSQCIQTTEEPLADENNTQDFGTSTEIQQPVIPANRRANKRRSLKETFEESLLTLLKETMEEEREEELDGDKLFLLSCLPALKRLDDIQKLDAKIEILAILKRMCQPNQEPFYQMPQGHQRRGSPQDPSRYYYEYNGERFPSGPSPPNTPAYDES